MAIQNCFALRQDENGFACVIDCRGVTVPHLRIGTERNKLCAGLIVEALNELDTGQIEKILQAVGAYRFLEDLSKRPQWV